MEPNANTESLTEGTETKSNINEPAKERTLHSAESESKGDFSKEKDIPSAEELAAFRKWQEEQKSDAEKQATAISKAEKARAEAEAKAASAELKLTAMSIGVSADALDDVIALAKTKITDKVTAEQAIDAIIAKYPVFGKAITTGVHTNNNNSSMSGVEAAFLAKNPGLKI